MPLLTRAGRCAEACAPGEFVSGGECRACSSDCAECTGAEYCSICPVDHQLRDGRCIAAASGRLEAPSKYDELTEISEVLKDKARAGGLDTGFPVTSLAIKLPVRLSSSSLHAAPLDVRSLEDSPKDKQRIRLTGLLGWSGSFRLRFNGEASEEVLISQTNGEFDVKLALQALPSIGTVSVRWEAAVVSASRSLVIEVEFSGQGTPLNKGVQPLLEVDTTLVDGLLSRDVTRIRTGAAPLNYTLEEQVVQLNASAHDHELYGHFTLGVDNVWTDALPANASAASVRTALTGLSNVGEVEVHLLAAARSHQAWRVRFHVDGTPPHVGPQPLLQVNASALYAADVSVHGTGSRRRLDTSQTASASSFVLTGGSSPFDGDQVLFSDHPSAQSGNSSFTDRKSVV